MSWQIVKDLKEKRAKAFADATEIRTKAHAENRDLTADEETRHKAFIDEIETFNKRLEREERAGLIGEAIAQNNRGAIGRDGNPDSGSTTEENSVGMPAKDFKRYSILRAVRMRLNNEKFDGVEGEVNAEMTKRMGKKAQGFWLPTDLRMMGQYQKRTLNAASTGTGSVMTTTESTFIDILRAKTVTGKIGTTFMTGLQGKIAIPQKTATAQGYWVGEGASPTAGQPTLSQVLFTPHTLGGYVDITRQFAEQTSLDAEAFVVDDLTRSLAVSLDVAAFVGTGTSNQPTGIVNASGVTINPLGTNGGDPTFLAMIAMETAVAVANADIGALNYVMTPAARGYLKGVPKSSSAVAAGFVWDDNEVNGYPAWATNVLPSNGTKGSGSNLSTIVFGNFNDLVIAMWGAVDLVLDPYTGSSSGTVRVVALQDCDIELRHAASFCVSTDATTIPGA